MTRPYNVLCYPNITYARNLEADSFVCDLRSLLPRITAALPEYRFTLMLPDVVESLRMPNVEQIEYPLPTYPNTMRTHFDAFRVLDILDWKRRAWDIVWTHLPEHTLALKNVIYNATDERPVFVGYSHWVEIPELNTFAADMFPAWVAGVREMDFCGVTTHAMKTAILRNAVERFGDGPVIEDLERIVHAQYLGVEAPPKVTGQLPEHGLFVWNHRPHAYTGWPSVLDALDRLWERRKDFRVMCSLSDGEVADKPYGAESGLPPASDPGYRRAYFELLKRAWAGLPRLVSHWTWPVAIADGMTAGMPYMVPRDYYEGEVFPSDYPWLYDGSGQSAGLELVDALDRCLDDPTGREYAVIVSEKAAADTSWDTRVESFLTMFRDAESRLRPIGERSTAYSKLAGIVRGHPDATKPDLKRAMGWGVGIPWTPYRTRLRKEGLLVGADGTADAAPSGHDRLF